MQCIPCFSIFSRRKLNTTFLTLAFLDNGTWSVDFIGHQEIKKFSKNHNVELRGLGWRLGRCEEFR